MAAKKYGNTAWGAWFLRMLQAYDGTGRLSRGKTYANTGRVFELNVNGQTVTAKVEGNYDPYYNIKIEFPPMCKKAKETIDKIFSENPFALAGLKQGFMSDDLIAALEKSKVEFIPSKWQMLKRSCSCPDNGDPCKHMAAVFFILAREIDFDPKLIFQIAGYDLAEMMKAHAYLSASEPAENGKAKQKNENSQSGTAEVEIEEPVPFSVRKKTTRKKEDAAKNDVGCASNELLNFERNDSYVELITKLVPSSNAFSENDFAAKLTGLYHESMRRFSARFFDDVKEENAFPNTGLYYASIAVNEKNLNKEVNNFPLDAAKGLTLKIQFTEKNSAEFTLLQAENFFTEIIESKKDFTESFCIAYSFYNLAKKIIYECAFVPAVSINKKTKRVSVFWKPLALSNAIDIDIEKFSEILTSDFFPPAAKWGKRYTAEILLTAYLTEYVHSLNFSPASNAADKEIDSLFFSAASFDSTVPGYTNLAKVIYTWTLVLNYKKNEYRYRLTILENESDIQFDSDNKDLKISAEVLNTAASTQKFVPLPKALLKSTETEKILQLPIILSSYLPTMAQLTKEESISIPIDDVAIFLTESAVLLRRLGVEIALPKTLQKTLKPKVVLSVSTKRENANVKSFLSLASLLEYDTDIMLGDEKISFAEFKKLLKQNERLIRFKNNYVLLDPDEVQRMLSGIETNKKLSPFEVMQEVLSENAVLTESARLQVENIFRDKPVAPPKNLNAVLRPYQENGFAWMYSNIKSGFGCLLADDMGLGKTIQVLSLILTLKEQGELHGENFSGVLIICPASLISNWIHEAKKFSPTLSTNIYHGAGRKLSDSADITFTTYQTAQSDVNKLNEKKFAGIVIDEAQAIKNAATKSAQSLKKIASNFRIALTGTPVENSLEDMRSIFDFILPGFLGDIKSFRTKWRLPIEKDGNKEIAAKLKKITAPFILRRLKTDKKIISDLPEKIISNNYCSLTAEQTTLYQALVESELGSIMQSDTPVKRRALILKLLTGLKQICNHPHAFDKSASKDYLLSGKMQTLILLLQKSFESGEKILVFSQYVETLNLIRSSIEGVLNTSCLVITGRQKPEQRTASVELFQNDAAHRVLLISLKAGGTGLNLTAASRVVHYDLWYNPAVEDQATDRAFRIGQKSNVFVNRLICEGTFEEKIDAMIQEKRNVANLVSSGETWISKLSNAELKEIISLQ